MVIAEEVNFNGFELVDLDEIILSTEGDCVFFIPCSKKLEKLIGEKCAAVQNLFNFPKFGRC